MNGLSYFFCGVGGSGMSALAAILRSQGARVSGSDRGRDQGQSPAKFASLEAMGIRLFPQDGSFIVDCPDTVVVSSAIENTIPDIKAAQDHGIPIKKRAEILAEMFNAGQGIGIAGTSGKTTVTGMTGVILAGCACDPVIVNGGIMLDFLDHGLGNVRIGHPLPGQKQWFVAEMDESDGTIALFSPDIAVVNNITLDHKPLPELRPLFIEFVRKARLGAVINLDDAEAALLPPHAGRAMTYGIDRPDATLDATSIELHAGYSIFTVTDHETRDQAVSTLRVPGRHNISNALAAMAAAKLAGIGLGRAAQALGTYKGIRRRLEVVGQAGGVTVIDDFAHNPDKIAASLATLGQNSGRLLIMFQPHGFGPMRMMRRELVQAFANGMRADDILLMPEIFYAGGTTVRDISSGDLIGDLVKAGRQGLFLPTRQDAGDAMLARARPGDRLVVMGARDDTLSDFARSLLDSLGQLIVRAG